MPAPNLNIFGSGSPRARRLSTSSSLAPKRSCMSRSCMPSIFSAVRLGVYFGVLVCTVICLAIAVHFESVLESSDLTHFVPFAIFVSVASLLVILALLLSTVLKQRLPISTRMEMASLGLLAVLWLALGSYLAVSEAAEADVECFSSDSTVADPVELPGFTTAIFHAQYRVLEAFSIFNLILVWGFLLVISFLAYRQHRKGYKVWLYPVPAYPWFGRRTGSSPYMHNSQSQSQSQSRNKGLPIPVTAKDNHRKGSTRRSPAKTVDAEKAKPEYRKSAFWVILNDLAMSTVSHFVTVRRYTYAVVFVSACVVLGLGANFANLFLPHINRPFVVFAVVVPAFTLVTFLIISQRSRPLVDLILLFILDVLWLAMGAWSTDIIGGVQCFGLTGTQPTKTGTMPATTYCYEMKSIEAFSWANFGILTIAFVVLVILINRLASYGQFGGWNTSISEVPWFGQPYQGGQFGPYGGYGGNPQAMFAGNGQMPYVIQQAPGHSVVIQPNPGGMPTVAQVPGTISG
ncbi:hypothetical protein EW145_g7801 [Phellinidium pouzarii]|uniref:MARVEL domain-containing protein n=1 Tax=Phellinidium pouzarii TaxID=167371 RepID=A0A4S4KDV6_9AGAM|nr:hypothetical protein EW145_g7801 [Phellinidium pouzarii]